MSLAVFRGVRGRVTVLVFAVTAVLYSLLATIGFVRVASGGREAIVDRIDAVMDQLERSLLVGSPTVQLSTADGVKVVAVTGMTSDEMGEPSRGTLQRERVITVDGQTLTLIGTSSAAPLTDSLRSLFRALWVGVPVAAIVSALLAGVATKKALRPVADMTALADSIGASPGAARVPLPDADDEIDHLARTMNGMLDRIELGQRRQRRFTSDAAHELRTPLMALRGEVELVQQGTESFGPATAERLARLCDRLAELTDDLLLLATLDEGRQLAARETDLGALVRAEVAELAPAAQLVLGADLSVPIDAALMVRAVRNLLANAVRHARREVTVTVERSGDRVWVHVDDDGPGIPADLRAQVFERFGRADESRSGDRGGAGLGLAIVAAAAAAHGGGAVAGEASGGGARVSIWVPAG